MKGNLSVQQHDTSKANEIQEQNNGEQPISYLLSIMAIVPRYDVYYVVLMAQ